MKEQDQQSQLQTINNDKESSSTQQQGNKKPNNTGIPDRLKAVIEHFSGLSLDEVRVHYNSDKPALVNAHAYAEGLNIYVAPGQEKHLAQEIWHVVQQMKNKLPATETKGGKKINNDPKMEENAVKMGEKAEKTTAPPQTDQQEKATIEPSGIIQREVVTLTLGDQQIQADFQGGYYKLAGSNSYISADQVQNNVVKEAIRPFVEAYLQGNYTLYRGMASWHPAWFSVTEKQTIPPLGKGAMPDFATNNTVFIPFTPTRSIAVGAAMGNSGMGPGDNYKAVHDLSHNAGEARGAVLSVTIGTDTPVGFYNEGEIQVKGPIQGFAIDRINMGDNMSDALELEGDGDELISSVSPLATQEEKDSYTDRFGSMRHQYIKTIYASVNGANRFAAAVRTVTNEAETYFREMLVPVAGVDESGGYSDEKKAEMAAQFNFYLSKIIAIQDLGDRLTNYIAGNHPDQAAKVANIENIYIHQLLSARPGPKIASLRQEGAGLL